MNHIELMKDIYVFQIIRIMYFEIIHHSKLIFLITSRVIMIHLHPELILSSPWLSSLVTLAQFLITLAQFLITLAQFLITLAQFSRHPGSPKLRAATLTCCVRSASVDLNPLPPQVIIAEI
jgi:hypothetical protein